MWDPLPHDLWIKILKTLVNDLELDGVRGPSVIARELGVAAQVNRELHAASWQAFEYLASQCQPIEESLACIGNMAAEHAMGSSPSSPLSTSSTQSHTEFPCAELSDTAWDILIHNPGALTLGELRILYSAAGLKLYSVSFTCLVTALKCHVDLEYPSAAPVRLRLAVTQEKRQSIINSRRLFDAASVSHLGRSYRDLFGYLAYGVTFFKARKRCIELGYHNMQALMIAAAADKNNRDPWLGPQLCLTDKKGSSACNGHLQTACPHL